MTNNEKYNSVFLKIFSLETGFDVNMVKMGEISDWDSVGHMELLTEIEDTFGIMLEMEDMLAFRSYEDGINILKKYNVEIEG